MDVIDEESSRHRGNWDGKDGTEMKAVNTKIDQECNKNGTREIRPAPIEILHKVRFNTSQETPRSTIKGFLNLPNQTELKFSNDNLKKAEDQLKNAFVQFYHKLRLLKSYRY